MIGIGIGLPYRRRAQAGIAISSPAPGTTFYTLEATSVSLVGIDGTYETSWQSDFATTNGDIVVSGGTGTGNVTPAWADGIASPERATLYLRNKAVGGAATATLSAPIYTSPHAAVQDGTVLLAYDLARASTVTQGAGVCTEWRPIVGGTSADYLTTVGASPTYNATDSSFGGRPSVEGDGATMGLGPTTPGSSVAVPLDAEVTVIATPPTGSPDIVVAGGDVQNRHIYTYSGQWRLASGTGATVFPVTTGVTVLLTAFFSSGTESVLRVREYDGVVQALPLVDCGTGTARGFSVLCRYPSGYWGDGAVTAVLATTDLSAADVYRLEQWYQLTAARGGCAASGWTAQLDASCYLGVAGYWPTDPTDGTVSVSEASVPADASTWDSNTATVTATSVRATTGSQRHYAYESSPTNVVDSYCDVVLAGVAAAGSQTHARVWAGADWANVVLSTGLIATTSGSDVTQSAAWTVQFRSVAARDVRIELLEPGLGDDSSATPSAYAGSASNGLDYTSFAITQARVSNVADQSGLAADLAQATDANQPLFWNVTENGLAIPAKEDGRAVRIVADHATIDAIGTTGVGAYPSFTLVAIAALRAPSGANRAWIYRFGSNPYDCPLTINNSNELRSQRYDDVTGFDSQAYPTVVASAVSSLSKIIIVSKAAGTRDLYVNGAGPYTITLASISSLTPTKLFGFGYTVTTDEADVAQSALFAGELTYAQAAVVANQMGDKYGL